MRVRNPVQLAEVIMAEDKGWDKEKVNELITTGPEDNDVALDHPIPVHVTYFTAWVDDDGTLKTFNDIYNHESKIHLGLEGKAHLIPQQREEKYQPVARGLEGKIAEKLAELKARDAEWKKKKDRST